MFFKDKSPEDVNQIVSTQEKKIQRLFDERGAIDTLRREAVERLKEAQFLLRQVFYARCIVGTKLCDELEKWNLEDLHERILIALEEKKP